MKPNGYVVWEGPSEVDGNLIVLIITGTGLRSSQNPKTGWMIQSWILRSDIHPMEAIRTNGDQAICGDCPLRGVQADNETFGHFRACYVNLATPGQVYSSYKKGKYPLLQDTFLIRRRAFRLGAYGDPAAVPHKVWLPILRAIDPTLKDFPNSIRKPTQGVARTGYTHLWEENPQFQAFCMASVDSAASREQAKKKGWRTYRIKGKNDLVLSGEIVCPASLQNEQRTTCIQCGLCGGTSVAGPDIVIDVHGSRSKYF